MIGMSTVLQNFLGFTNNPYVDQKRNYFQGKYEHDKSRVISKFANFPCNIDYNIPSAITMGVDIIKQGATIRKINI